LESTAQKVSDPGSNSSAIGPTAQNAFGEMTAREFGRRSDLNGHWQKAKGLISASREPLSNPTHSRRQHFSKARGPILVTERGIIIIVSAHEENAHSWISAGSQSDSNATDSSCAQPLKQEGGTAGSDLGMMIEANGDSEKASASM
jgi:hypothetical protein